MGFREGWSTRILTQDLMSSPGPQAGLVDNVRLGYLSADAHSQAAPQTEYRNYRRSGIQRAIVRG